MKGFLSGLLLMSTPVRAVVLFVDLNNAPKEYLACKDGAGDDQVHVVSRTFNATDKFPDGRPVSIADVRKKMNEIEANGDKIDSIVISGHHDGTGDFIGLEGGGAFSSDQLDRLLNEKDRAQTKRSVISLGLIGCYTSTVEASEQFWVLPKENVKQAVGFALQGTTKDQEKTAGMVAEYCKNRVDWADKSKKSELCEIYKKFNEPFRGLNVSICSREAVASEAYAKDGNPCWDYAELHDRCGEFDPKGDELKRYMKFLAANDPCNPQYNNPPVDKGRSKLRRFYDADHLYRHCAARFRESRKFTDPRDGTEGKYDLPDPNTVLRLIKYDDIKNNIATLNRRELADYDRRLNDLCLGQFALGDITQLNRAEMNRRIQGANNALMSSKPVAQKYGYNSVPEPNAIDEAGEGDAARAPAASSLADFGDDTPAAAPAPRVTPAPTIPASSSSPPAGGPGKSAAAPRPAEKAENPSCAAGPPARPPRVCVKPDENGVVRTDPAIVHRMAQGLKQTFVDMNFAVGEFSRDPKVNTFRSCSHFQLVEPNADKIYKSQCVVGYYDAATIDEGIF